MGRWQGSPMHASLGKMALRASVGFLGIGWSNYSMWALSLQSH